MINAVILDLDGLIIDSEPLWKEAEIKSFKEVGLILTTDMCAQTTGLDTNDVVKYWYSRHPWETLSHHEMKTLIESNLVVLIQERGEAMPGLHHLIQFVKTKNLPLAVASSSTTEIIRAVLSKLEIIDEFVVIHSSEHEELGKPNPSVYISTANKLSIHPTECLAFEDSFFGLLAAKSARCKAVVVPEMSGFENPMFGFADLKIKSLIEFTEDHFNRLSAT